MKHIHDLIKGQVAFYAWRAYAAHSYLYYVLDESIIDDSEYDSLCHWILENYDWIKPYDINNYLDRDGLDAGTGYHIAEKVCGQTREYALLLLADHEKAVHQREERAEKQKTKKKKPKPKRTIDDDIDSLIG